MSFIFFILRVINNLITMNLIQIAQKIHNTDMLCFLILTGIRFYHFF
jgi:hypothetical protein